MGLDMYLYEKQVHEVAYWRKANAIHGWIINNSGAVDNCTPIHLTKQDLIQLRDDCQKVLDEGTAETAMKLLPPTEGFFFGSNNIDEWYWEDIKDTIEKLNTALEQSVDDAMFEYQASWQTMSEYATSGDSYEDAKMLTRKIHEFFRPDIQVIHDALIDAYEYGKQQGIESERNKQ